MMCKLKGQMDKGHYDVEMMRVDVKGGIYDVQIKMAGWIRQGIIMWKSKGGCTKGGIIMCNLKGADG